MELYLNGIDICYEEAAKLSEGVSKLLNLTSLNLNLSENEMSDYAISILAEGIS